MAKAKEFSMTEKQTDGQSSWDREPDRLHIDHRGIICTFPKLLVLTLCGNGISSVFSISVSNMTSDKKSEQLNNDFWSEAVN